MSNCWITVIPPESAAGQLKTIYEQVKSPNNQVDMVYQAQSLRPETISGHDTLYKSVLHIETPACPPWFLEAVAVYTSVLNSCTYAATHHTANLKHLLRNPGRLKSILDAFQSNTLSSVFDGKELALLEYAQKLTLWPGDLDRSDIEQLRRQGSLEEEILEVNQVVACFNYSNRVINGLGVQLGDEQVGFYGKKNH